MSGARLLFFLLLHLLVTGWIKGASADNRYLSIGDGTASEFSFPEHSQGVLLVSSLYPGPSAWLSVNSLEPTVVMVENVSASWGGGFMVGLQSGLAGLAPLQLQLLEENHLIEERTDFRIRVHPSDPDLVAKLGLGHFSENPVLYALLPLIFLNKCAFGCKVEVEALRSLVRQPHPVLLGILGQFVVMPLYGYLMSVAFSLPTPLALGLVISCSSPGGGGGYLYSLLLGGDVTVAISMTLLSTVAATGLMPLSSTFYGWLLGAHETLHVPFLKILVTLLFIAVPISSGMLVKCKLPRLSRLLLVLIKPFSFTLIIGGLFMAYHMGAFILANVQPPIVLAGITVPIFGLLLGYLLAWCLGLPGPQCRTVSIEVGVQNSLLALAVLQLSFQRAQADFASQAPFIVALSSTSEMLLLVLGNLAYNKLCSTCS
ncbi:P3 protein [Pogona vitticeps]|uniref:P3 protein n=1 Tax=Pogona vitticeps TaxID=103695 RepID=A0A6J0TMI1_9SAUR|nr:P3 protein [Pogona vitticeps]XP_020648717.1 P3 protein [Pogona vitticeps]XP_020648718.1 P3 protein [Pogona vitticeps]XP_020648719.1 P3 protein [Pogona vitticeps]XP_020648720.1 P3 protein [Pogona vitticeps]XP_020648721.1 P3 protein [Pogona vitticeps]XP_020648722.1 P3 protein [Pogona vitticeps]XP_020648723.1 P3 protein [Pogona vitticeps]